MTDQRNGRNQENKCKNESTLFEITFDFQLVRLGLVYKHILFPDFVVRPFGKTDSLQP